MAQGWQSGGQCFPTIDRAGADACSRAFGVTNSGLLSCSGYAVVGNEVQKSNERDRYRVTVRLDSGDRIALSEFGEGALRIGDRVRVVNNRVFRI